MKNLWIAESRSARKREPDPEACIASIVRDARMKVAEAFFSGGPDAALAAVASQSIRLAHHVEDGSLIPRVAFRTLLQVTINLRLVDTFGRATVRRAINWGPQFFEFGAAA